MAVLMLLFLIAFTIISYFMGKRSLLSPWFLLCAMFLVTYSIVLINYSKWEVSINLLFVIYVTTAILSFGVGCFLIQSLNPHVKARNSKHNILTEESVIITKYPVNLFLIISILFSCIYIVKLMFDAGFNGSFTDILRRIYDMQSVGNYSPNAFFIQLREVVVAIAYINVFRLLIRLYSKKDKLSIIKLILPLIMFFILIMVSTERNLFLRFAIYSVCIWVIIYSRKHIGKNVNLKIIIRAVLILAVIVILFFLLGVSKQYTSSFFDQISIYSASGLNNFNIWLETFDEQLLFGQSTFTTFLGSLGTVLGRLGICQLGGTVDQIDPFISYVTADGYHYYTNIYSALKPYVEDFGYFGVILFPAIIGAFYQWLYLKTQKSGVGLSFLIYCMLIYPIIYFPILEQLFRRFHLGFMYELVWISVLFYFVFKRKNRKGTKDKLTPTEEVRNA